MNGAALLLALACLAGCAAKPPLTRLATLEVEAAPDANERGGTRLDLVFVFDSGTDAKLPPTGAEWYAARTALLAANGGALQSLELQLPAPYRRTAVALPAGYAKAIGVYAYASYVAAAGQGRCKLTPFAHVTLRLQYDHFDCAGR